MKKLLISVILLLTAVILLVLLLIPSVILVLFIGITLINKKKAIPYYSNYIRQIAYSLDQLGNVLCKELFDLFLIKKESTNLFGNPDETISSVLGKNELGKNLTIIGKLLVWILNKLDYEHTKNAIEKDE